ncbi:MAG: molybdenum cofactor guanylyltransferase [Candidatus Thorarchaeota archaeon]|nr:molybdenum cofactor guanylyltransferase [Candidatus Thorarchaeota archaeon]
MKDITVAIVAGGSSKRFGSEKSLAEFQGKPLLTHMLDIAQQISSNILVVVSDEEQEVKIKPLVKTGQIVFDPEGEPQCALTGALSAFEHTESSHTLLLPVDAPLAEPNLLKMLIRLSPGHGAVVPSWPSGYIEPLHSVYLAEHAYVIGLDVMEKGLLRMRDLLDRLQNVLYVSTETLNQFDPELNTFMNFNTTQELKSAERKRKQK